MVSYTDPITQMSAQPQYNPLANWTQYANPAASYYNPQQIAPQGAIGQQLGGLIGSLLPFQAQPQYNPITHWTQAANPITTIGQYHNPLQQAAAQAAQTIQAAQQVAQQAAQLAQQAAQLAQQAQAACAQHIGGLAGSIQPFNAQSQFSPLGNWTQAINPYNAISPYSNAPWQWNRPYSYGSM